MPWFFDRSLQLASLGRVLHRDDLIDEGLCDARAFFAAPVDSSSTHDSPRQPNRAPLTAYIAESDGCLRVAEEMLQAQALMDRRFELQQWGTPQAQGSRPRAELRQTYLQRRSSTIAGFNETRNDLVALTGLYSR